MIKDPIEPTSGTMRTSRGGAWSRTQSGVRAAARNNNRPDYRSDDIGFRVVCLNP